MDVSGQGKTICYWIWDGYHIENMYTTKGTNSKAFNRLGRKNTFRGREFPYENFAFDGYLALDMLLLDIFKVQRVL